MLKENKVKLGIITFHDTLNYGASLQCYALQKKLNAMGIQTEVINYQCPKFVKEYSPFFVSQKNLRKFLYMLVAIKMNLAKQRKKVLFQKQYLPLSKKYTKNTITQANDEYDAFITGSDQVWNWKLTDFDTTYFLDFVKPPKKKFSYAASFGLSKIDDDKKSIYQSLLADYDQMSVRERKGAEIVQELISKTADVVADPVLLLEKAQWEEIATVPNIDDYILLYSINDTIAPDYAKQLAKKTGKRLVYLSAPIKCRINCKKVRDIGPLEFLGWFKNASYIVTDSFHGTVYSVLFEKQFVSLQDRRPGNHNSRIVNFLEEVGLTDRIIDSLTQQETLENISNYSIVKEKLHKYIKKSNAFLKSIIGALENESSSHLNHYSSI